MRNNIVLIGMSGAGKSTIGVLLAKVLGMDFVDTDIMLQQKAGRKLQDIIDSDGIEIFLQLEEEAVSQIDIHDSVIATGGSVVYSAAAMSALAVEGMIVYLKLPFYELERRLNDITTRGIVMQPGAVLEDVFLEREPLYEKYCDLSVDCTGLSVEQCVLAVADAIR